MQPTPEQEAFQWQVGVWDRISQLYFREIDLRFASVVAGALRRADLKPGEIMQCTRFPVIHAQAGIHRVSQVALCYGFPLSRERQCWFGTRANQT
jgi:hypothetical protein